MKHAKEQRSSSLCCGFHNQGFLFPFFDLASASQKTVCTHLISDQAISRTVRLILHLENHRSAGSYLFPCSHICSRVAASTTVWRPHLRSDLSPDLVFVHSFSPCKCRLGRLVLSLVIPQQTGVCRESHFVNCKKQNLMSKSSTELAHALNSLARGFLSKLGFHQHTPNYNSCR